MIRPNSRPESIGQIAARISKRVQKLSQPVVAVPNPLLLTATSRQKLERWLTYETQAKAMAIASELGWTVDRVLTVAIGLLAIQARNPKSRAALRITEGP